MRILKLKVEVLLTKKSENFNIFVRAESNWVDNIVNCCLARLILSIGVELKSSLVFKDYLKDHLVVLHDCMHNWVTTIRISDISLGSKL